MLSGCCAYPVEGEGEGEREIEGERAALQSDSHVRLTRAY